MSIPHVPTAALILLVTLVTTAEPPFDAARSSLIPDIVGDADQYNAASTLSNTTNQLSVVIGFAVGGAIVAGIGAHGALILDSATFAASALLTARFVLHRPVDRASGNSFAADLREGAFTVFKDARLRWLVLVTWLVLGLDVSTETAAVPYAVAHGRGSTTAGFLIASLPLGMTVGGLVLGRVLPLVVSERLMLPMALAAPAVLAMTAANPDPAVAGVIWFAVGALSAMTITANRVFVLSVPRAVRGRAFGIAVTGIAASQGLYSLLAGGIARYTGAAHAVADLALPTFALIVLVSIGTATFRKDPKQPIRDHIVADHEDDTMPAAAAKPAQRAWALNAALLAACGAGLFALNGHSAYSDVHLPGWWLFIVFVVSQIYSLNFLVRNQSFQVVLETVPLVLGLVFLPPLELVALRVGAIVVVHAFIHRLDIVKWVFNAASTGAVTYISIVIFLALVPSHDELHPRVWPATFAAVIASEGLLGILVVLVLALTGARRALRRTIGVIGFGAAATVVMTFLALVTAAALEYDLSTGWAISVFLFLVIAASQTYHRVAERAAALDQLYVVARELGPLATEPADLAPALMQLREVMHAGRLELTVLDPTKDGFATVVAVAVAPNGHDTTTLEEKAIDVGLSSVLHSRQRSRLPQWLGIGVSREVKDGGVSTSVHTAGRELGVLTAFSRVGTNGAFERRDLRLLEAAADQLAAALEKGRLVESLRRAATLDTLTGLANLESLRTFLDTSFEGAAGVLLLINLDRFHEVNDMLGHDAGDAVLAEIARRLESSPSQGTLVARVGGDQFAIAIPGAAGSEVARLAAMAVKSRVDGSIRFAEVSADVRVTIGIARAPDHGSDSATLLRRAEMAMAAAKGSTSGIGEWEPEYERDGSRRLQLLTGLRAALGDGSLRVEYQPKLRLGSGEVSGFEALVRWSHPELGAISPAEFVPIAEATGLISALTSTVLRQALATCRAWHDAGKPVGVAVNVSARSLDDSVLIGQVAAMLTASGLEPRWLTLEITESSLMEDQSRSLEVLSELRMLGVRLSIDDFGTGYSSLHQLRGLPVHEVKIDRSFIATVDTDEADRAVVRAVVELCDSLGLVTVAEGVEKATQTYALEALGVRQVQGYFHGRPMSDAVAMEWLASRPVASLASHV
jgi:diguanylate cyclase (GGDEF)-like protein